MRTTEITVGYEQEEEWSDHPADQLQESCASDRLSEDEARERSDAYFRVVSAMEQQLLDEGGQLDLESVRHLLRDEEFEGLQRFDLAVQGTVNGRPMLAEARLAQLGDALALLQPVLAVGLHASIPRAMESFQTLVDLVDELHEELVDLEDAQGELFEQDREPVAGDEAAEPDENADQNADQNAEPTEAEQNADQVAGASLMGGADDPAVELLVVASTLFDGPGTE